MSLINDALKKASQTPAPTSPAATKEPLRIATHQPAPRWPMFVVPPLVAVVFAAGTLLVMRGWQSGAPVSAKEAVTQSSVAASKIDESQAPVSTAASTANAGTTNVTAATASAASATNSAPAAPTFPVLKVQGLIWHPQRPSVVINGKSLFIGEKIERAMVTAIDQESVTVVWNGQQRVLTLP